MNHITDNELKVFERFGNKEFKIQLLEKEGYRLSSLEKEVIMSEDCVLFFYKDTVGIETNLIGKTGLDKNKKYDLDDAIMFMREDLKISEHGCERIIKNFNYLTQDQREALIEMAYNMGVTGLQRFPSMIKAIENEDWVNVVYEAFNSKWAFQVGRDRSTKIVKKLKNFKRG